MKRDIVPFSSGSAMPLEFTIPDMACGACANTIEQAIKAIDPTAEMMADTTTKLVKITTTTPSDTVKQTIEQAGFHPQTAA
jgi:copper chaperone